MQSMKTFAIQMKFKAKYDNTRGNTLKSFHISSGAMSFFHDVSSIENIDAMY